MYFLTEIYSTILNFFKPKESDLFLAVKKEAEEKRKENVQKELEYAITYVENEIKLASSAGRFCVYISKFDTRAWSSMTELRAHFEKQGFKVTKDDRDIDFSHVTNQNLYISWR